MPEQQRYLSVDPDDGEPVRPAAQSRYLSEDPNEGEPLRVASRAQRFGESFVRNVLPSTRAADYIEGPLYALQHPLDALSLLVGAVKDAHGNQAAKTGEAAQRVISAPTLGGKVGALSETLGHGLATVLPMVGPAAANAGEQIASGDIAGGLGATTGLLTPSALAAGRGIAAPVRARVAEGLHQDALTRVGKALNPTTRENKVRTERIAPEMLERRVTARNLQKLEETAAAKSNEAGAKVEAALAPHADDLRDTMSLVDELEKAKEEFTGTTATGEKVINDKGRVGRIQKLQDTLMEYGDQISVGSMVKLRRNWDRVVEAGKGFTTPKAGERAWAAREGRSVLRDDLVEAVPNLDQVNADFSFWQTLEDITAATNQRRQGQKGDLTSTIAGAGGAVAAEVMMPGAGAVKGGLQAALGAKVFASLKRFVDSPGWQLWSAVQKERLADALMSKDVNRVQGLISEGMRAASQGSRTMGRLQSGRPVPQAADATDPEGSPRASGRGTPR